MSDETEAPARLRAGSHPPGGAEYALRPELVALHGGEGGVRVVPRGAEEAAGAAAGPVYALPGGTLAVPTGRVLLRFREGVDAAARAEEVRGAGFRLEGALPHAPHAAWVAPESGGIADALRGIGRLLRLAEVEGADPELLSERAFRG
ncbi:MAG TPA: hypothetical protein VF263_12845 [Longimicrobiaceae bacterium]